MAITIRGVRPLDRQMSKLVVEGQPISASSEVSVSQVLEFYRRRADSSPMEAVADDNFAADLPAGASAKE